MFFIEVEDYVLIPYYIQQGKRMELYEYELKIVVDSHRGFEEYILTSTGKQNLEQIPDEIVKKQKKCYIECEKNTCMIKLCLLKGYLKFLLSNDDIQCMIKEKFEYFNDDNLFFEIY